MTKKNNRQLLLLKKLSKKTLASGAVLLLVIVTGITVFALQSTSKPAKHALDVSGSSGSNSVPICIEGQTGCPSFGSSSNSQASTTAPASSSGTSSPAKPTTNSPSTSSGPSDAEIAALYCSGEFATIQTNDQTNLDSSRISAISNAQGEINTYNQYGGEPGATVTVNSVNQFIDQENNGIADSYQQYVSGLQPSSSEYGCTISLRQEMPLPSFNPPNSWNP